MKALLSRLFRSSAPSGSATERLPEARQGDGLEKGDPRASAERAADEREMIKGVRELGETTVKEVMVPRIDTVFLPIDSSREDLVEKVVACGHSRIPVYSDTIDSVVGVLYAKDLLRVLV